MITEVHDMSVISADEEVLKYARIGAEATLKELLRNAGEVRDFLGRIAPRSAWGDGKPAIVPGQEPVPDQPVAVATPVAMATKKTREWSDEARKEVSDRMTKYWADRRAAEKQNATSGAKGKTAKRKPVWTPAMRAAASRRGKAQAARRKKQR